MRARMLRLKAITFGTAALVFTIGNLLAVSQSTKPVMTGLAPYLMERNAEISLARSAAPESISRDADVLVLGPHGYETAVKGANGFVCMVGRGWGMFDWPEFWNP